MLTSTRKQTAAANANDQRGGDDKRKQRPDVTARRILATKNPELVERAKRGGFGREVALIVARMNPEPAPTKPRRDWRKALAERDNNNLGPIAGQTKAPVTEVTEASLEGVEQGGRGLLERSNGKRAAGKASGAAEGGRKTAEAQGRLDKFQGARAAESGVASAKAGRDRTRLQTFTDVKNAKLGVGVADFKALSGKMGALKAAVADPRSGARASFEGLRAAELGADVAEGNILSVGGHQLHAILDRLSSFDGSLLTPARIGLDLSRLCPGVNFVTGQISEGIATYQNLSLAYDTGDGYVMAADGLRELVNHLATFVSTIETNGNYAQNLAFASVLGVPAGATMAGFNEFTAGATLVVDQIKVLTDIIALATMHCRRDDIAANGGDLDALNELETTMCWNLGADIVDVVLDLYSLASAGFGQGGVIDEGSEAVATIAQRLVRGESDVGVLAASSVFAIGTDVLNNPQTLIKLANTIGSWAGIPVATHPGDPAAKLAGHAWRKAGDVVGAGYRAGTNELGGLSAHLKQRLTEGESFIAEVTGVKEPVAAFAKIGAEAIGDCKTRVSDLEGMAANAAEGKEAAMTAKAGLDGLESALGKIKVPEIPDPDPADFGDNTVADFAESVVDTGLKQAQKLVEKARKEVEQLIHQILEEGQRLIQEGREKVEEALEFCTEFERLVNEQVKSTNESLTRLQENLGKCDNFEDIFQLLLDEVARACGFEEGLSIESLEQMWADVGGKVEQFQQWTSDVANKLTNLDQDDDNVAEAS